jgi:adenosylmethionine-8-amino-7-oxononanoate aminotransferase
MALQYWINRGVRGRTRFISFRGGYHGDTIAAMSVCDPEEGMHALFRGALPPQHLAALPRDEQELAVFESFVATHAAECAGLIIEPLVQGAGGMRFHSAEMLARIVAIARANDLLVLFDEIFTGFGRTGSLFACLGADVVPDIVTLSKSLSGGTLPLAATVASDRVFGAFWSDSPEAALMHGPTFMGNPLACAAANASLDLFESEPRLEQVARIAEQLAAQLEPCRTLPGVRDVRVRGAIGVVQLERLTDPAGLRTRFLEAGVWIRPFGDIVYLTPALTIEEGDLTTLTQAIHKVLGRRRGDVP